MKALKIKILFTLIVLFAVSCDDSGFLEEDLRDRFTTENAYMNAAQFKTGTNQMYRQVRAFYNSGDGPEDWYKHGIGADMILSTKQEEASFSFWNLLSPDASFPNKWYNRSYELIKNSNELLFQTDNENVKWVNEEQKLEIQAEIRFFRGFAYRNLATLFGGVPIVLEPILAPKLDFERASRIETYTVAMEDLLFASNYLPIETDDPGRVVKAAASHFLSEVYIALGDEMNDKSMYDKAIAAASRVIDGTDGNYELMSKRFGSRMNEEGKDAYWDLFRMGNQNYHDGNKESIWAIQFERNISGGTNIYDRPLFERIFWPNQGAANKFGYTAPHRDWNGKGNGWAVPTNYSKYYIWKDSETDLRNASHNIQRYFFAEKYIVDGKQTDKDTVYVEKVNLSDGTQIEVSVHAGDTIRHEWLTSRNDTLLYFYPKFWKFGTDKHIDGLPDNGYVRDAYVVRFPETYFLRAEAFMKSGQIDKAALDINTVRARAKATPINASQVTIDFILDERARELYGEEWRMHTLARLGLMYDRTTKFGWPADAKAVKKHHNLFPIPQTAIDGNLENRLEQNPGY